MQREAVVFSPQVIAVILEHQRLMAKALKSWYGLTPAEYCVMRAAGAAEGSVSSETLADFVMLRRGTVFVILTNLETKRLIRKNVDLADRRVMHVDLTEDGSLMAAEATRRLYELLKSTFWQYLPERDLFEVLFNSPGSGADALRGKAIPQIRPAAASEALPVELPLIWYAMVNRWQTAVKDASGLAFSEYRILALLEDFGGLNPSDISDRLFIERSNVSLYKRRLIARGLLREVEDEHDRRRVILQCTKAGAKMARDLNEAVSRVTRAAHAHLPDVGVTIVNAWYARMYCNLGSVRLSEKILQPYK